MRVTFIFCLVFLFSSCTARKIALKNADTLISYQITKRIPLYYKEKNQLDKDIDQFLHKSKPVAKKLATTLETLNLNGEILVDDHYKKIETTFSGITRDFSILLATYIAKLNREQAEIFFKNLEKENEDDIKKINTPTRERFEKWFKVFFGSFNESQKTIALEYSNYFKHRYENRITKKVELQKKMKELLLSSHSQDDKALKIQQMFFRYQEQLNEGNQNIALLNRILPTLSGEQKKYFHDELKDIKELINYFIQLNY